MTDKEIARFKVKFPKINLSKERLAALKLNLADDADETTIDTKLDEVNGYFPYDEIAKADDRNRQQPPKPTPTPTPAPVPSNDPPAGPTPADDTPEWAKALVTSVATLTTELNTIKAGKTTDSRKSQLEAKLTDATDAFKNTTLKAFNRMQFKDDEEFNAYLGEVETDAAEFVQTEANTGLSQTKAPVKSNGNNPTKTASKEEVKAIFG